MPVPLNSSVAASEALVTTFESLEMEDFSVPPPLEGPTHGKGIVCGRPRLQRQQAVMCLEDLETQDDDNIYTVPSRDRIAFPPYRRNGNSDFLPTTRLYNMRCGVVRAIECTYDDTHVPKATCRRVRRPY